MGHYSELYFSDSSAQPARGAIGESAHPYLVSKYHVPLLWLALFATTDIVDGVPDDNEEAWPYLVKSKSAALALLSSRGSVLAESFPALKPIWLQQFTSMVQRTGAEYIHLDTSDIGAMADRADSWRLSLEAMLRIFSVPPFSPAKSLVGRLLGLKNRSREWQVFNRLLGSAFSGADANEPWVYCGASGTDEEFEWETSPTV